MLPKGKSLKNPEAIETIVHLGSVGIQRVLAEDAIKQSEAKYRTLVEQSHEGITIASGDKIIFANNSFLQILGYDSLDDLVNVSIMDIIAPESKEITLSMRKQIHAGRQEYDAKLIGKNGQFRDINIKTSEIVLNGEKCIQSSFIDITERKLAEENRSRMQKLEALGILAGGIAHDFNNLHGGIFGYIECAIGKKSQAEAEKDLKKALNCMDRARELTARLLTFSKGGAPCLETASLFPFADEVMKDAVNGTDASYTIEANSDLRHCLYDKIQLRQVIYSIMRNAVDAMPTGGNIRVSAGNVTFPKRNRLGLNEGNYLHVSIADNGVGISKNNLSHLFDPFFSTKPNGSGLNLSIAHSVLKRHEGSIDVESVLGKGTTFHIYLRAVN